MEEKIKDFLPVQLIQSLRVDRLRDEALLLLEMVPQEAGLVGDVEIWNQSQGSAETLLIGRKLIITWTDFFIS